MRVASSPLSTGMETSMIMISGFNVSASLMASWPFSASPQSSHSGNERRIPWTPRRITAWSSTTKTRDINPPRRFEGRGRPSKFSSEHRPHLSFNNLVSNGVAHELAHRVQLELAHDVGAMRLRSLYTNTESHRNFFATLSFGQQLHNFAFSGSEPAAEDSHVIRDGILLAKAIQQHVRGARSEERTTVAESLDSGNQVAVGVRLHNVGADARFDNIAHQLIGEMKREDDNFSLGKTLADAPSRFQTVELRHADIHDDNVWLHLLGHGDSFAARFGLGDHVPAMMRRQELFQTTPNDVVI